jgi:glucoside 3-dehydrogenase (cytochrome c) hitch-hiker subunit
MLWRSLKKEIFKKQYKLIYMDRRELLKMIAALTGGVVIGGEVFLTGCKTNDTASINGFSKDDIAFLDEVAETILPKTKTPGAKDAAVGQFMTVMVNDCYEPKNQEVFREGIRQLDESSKKMYNDRFMKLTPEKRHDLLVALDKEAKMYQKKKSEFDNEQNEKEKAEKAKGNYSYKKETMSAHYFTMMKQLTLLGFFTSQPGATQALRYIAIPGRYEGCVPYNKGDKAWA